MREKVCLAQGFFRHLSPCVDGSIALGAAMRWDVRVGECSLAYGRQYIFRVPSIYCNTTDLQGSLLIFLSTSTVGLDSEPGKHLGKAGRPKAKASSRL